MSRKSREHAAQAALEANRASDAGRTLQAARQQAAPASTPAPADTSVDPGTGEGEERPRPEPRNEPRRLGMEEIVARHQRTSGNTGEAEPTPEPAQPEQMPEPPVPTADQMLQGSKFSQAEPTAPMPEPAAAVPEPIKTIRVKVDGEEFDVLEADVQEAGGITAYQKDKASDNRLKKANETLAEAKRANQVMMEWVTKNLPAQAAQAQPTMDQFIASKMDTIRFGTPEEGAAAMREIMVQANPRVDQNALILQTTVHMGYNAARAAFVKEYGDVLANPLIAKLAQTLERDAVAPLAPNGQANWAQMAQVDWNGFFSHIGNQVRSVAGPRASQPATALAAAVTTDSTSPAPSDREARKASIVNLPTAAARAAIPEEAKPETREQVLESMKKLRGIQTG